MLLNFNAEERQLLQSVDAVIDIPRNTKPAVARKIYDNLKRLVSQLRGLAPVLEARGIGLRTQKKMTAAEVRNFVAAQYPAGAPFEEVARWRKLGYSIDSMNALRLADITQQLRQGSGLEPLPMRQEPGQTADPTDSLRDDDDFGWADDDWDTDKHERAAAYHRALASKATSMEKGVAHFKAADLHSAAARLYPDLNSSVAARAASKSLRHPENCL
jgi:hypothetical protein